MKQLSITSPQKALQTAGSQALKYSALAFVLFLVIIYGFLAWRIISLSQVEPNPADVTSQLKTAGVPEVNPEVVKKMQQLQDNSVNVRTIYDEARNNPFRE